MHQSTNTEHAIPTRLVIWHCQTQEFAPAEWQPKAPDAAHQKAPKFVARKCRPGQVWKYATGGVACIISVTYLDYAPQCEAIICRSLADIASVPRCHNGEMRTLGIMESELVELLGDWVPSFRPPPSILGREQKNKEEE
jgi:hypothetical protein